MSPESAATRDDQTPPNAGVPEIKGIDSVERVDLVERAYGLYAALAAQRGLDAESGLGGWLLYAGRLDGPGRSLLYAANIAGAASLAASADPVAQRQAMRNGVIDFLVTSLEEALRILKNEVRKKQPVSVGVALDPCDLVEAMLGRGVLPDLLPPEEGFGDAVGLSVEQRGRFAAEGARAVVLSRDWSCPDTADTDTAQTAAEWVTWSVDREPARWLPRLDSCALAALAGGDHLRERWLRLAPRYLGRLMQRERGVAFTAEELIEFRRRAGEMAVSHEEQTARPVITITLR